MNLTANELRIGNWVFYNKYGHCKNVKIEGMQHNIISNHQSIISNGVSIPVQDIDPIPLSEEILLKAGFVSIVENNNVYTLKNKIYGMFKTEYNKDGSMSDTYFEIYNEGTPLVKIRTLHHLQNYVHAITQTELTINL